MKEKEAIMSFKPPTKPKMINNLVVPNIEICASHLP